MAGKSNKRDSATTAGQLIPVTYQGREIQAIVIDPNGLGIGQPSIGLGFRMIDKYIGIPHNTLSNWVVEKEGVNSLKLPSGKNFRVVVINGSDGNSYSVVEVADWVALAGDLIKHPGKTKKTTTNKVVDFLLWFAVDGFYAQVYTLLKSVYTEKDSRAVQRWKQERELGKTSRKDYSDYINNQDRNYGKWTNVVYQGLFGVNAAKITQMWANQAGDPKIARNHIPEAVGLQAVAYCERLVVMLNLDNIRENHTEAIRLTRKKFKFDRQDSVA